MCASFTRTRRESCGPVRLCGAALACSWRCGRRALRVASLCRRSLGAFTWRSFHFGLAYYCIAHRLHIAPLVSGQRTSRPARPEKRRKGCRPNSRRPSLMMSVSWTPQFGVQASRPTELQPVQARPPDFCQKSSASLGFVSANKLALNKLDTGHWPLATGDSPCWHQVESIMAACCAAPKPHWLAQCFASPAH